MRSSREFVSSLSSVHLKQDNVHKVKVGKGRMSLISQYAISQTRDEKHGSEKRKGGKKEGIRKETGNVDKRNRDKTIKKGNIEMNRLSCSMTTMQG